MNEDTYVRFDQKLKDLYPDLSRAYISKLIITGQATINGKVATKPSQKVISTDKIHIRIPVTKDRVEIDIPVIYEDDNIVVIDKAPGILAHSKGDHNPEPTVASWLVAKLGKETVNNRDGIVHRLDRATSGVMVLAKNSETALLLQKQFSMRKVNKTYLAVIEGRLEPNEAMIDLPIERNPKKPQSFRVGANGKQALTAYRIIKSNELYSLIELKPKTGRTHQLRVHLKHLGHPILGDDFYKGKKADRLFLHAYKLEFNLPNGERRQFVSEIPKEFNEVMGKINVDE